MEKVPWDVGRNGVVVRGWLGVRGRGRVRVPRTGTAIVVIMCRLSVCL